MLRKDQQSNRKMGKICEQKWHRKKKKCKWTTEISKDAQLCSQWEEGELLLHWDATSHLSEWQIPRSKHTLPEATGNRQPVRRGADAKCTTRYGGTGLHQKSHMCYLPSEPVTPFLGLEIKYTPSHRTVFAQGCSMQHDFYFCKFY